MGDVLPLASPSGMRDAIVLGVLTGAWTDELTIARGAGLTVGVVRVALMRLFEAGRVMRRPASSGPEWKRT